MTTWEQTAHRKQQDRELQLEKYSNWRRQVPRGITDVTPIVAEQESQIIKEDATKLVEQIKKRVYTSVEVVTAFAKAAIAAQGLTNCLTEIFIERALIRAQELDDYLEKTGTTVGPLHGLPVSIKHESIQNIKSIAPDHIKIKDLDTSSGYVAWAYKTKADCNANVVDILQNAGAVLYVKTQNPQTLLSLETNNYIYGRTCNPYNIKLTCGGSSGGESALISCHGSCLGVGTDIGGSVRVPAGHCGLYGLKGSVARLPHAGLVGNHDGMDAIVGCVGPIASSARDLKLFCSVMLDAKPWLFEAPLLEMPWKSDIKLPERLSIAILSDDGVVAPHPPIADALRRYRKKLISAGHNIIDWKPLNHKEGWDLIVQLYFLDGGAEYIETMERSKEPQVQQTEWILGHAKGKPYTVAEIFRLNLQREDFRTKALAHWNATQEVTDTGLPVDVILCPVAATLAPPHDTTCWWGYSSHWNLLDLPGVVFPVGIFGSSDVVSQYPVQDPRNEIEEVVQKQWSPNTYHNAPISLQLVGRRHNEEALLAMLDVVERAGKEAEKN